VDEVGTPLGRAAASRSTQAAFVLEVSLPAGGFAGHEVDASMEVDHRALLPAAYADLDWVLVVVEISTAVEVVLINDGSPIEPFWP
jgi:hypothetical protein